MLRFSLLALVAVGSSARLDAADPLAFVPPSAHAVVVADDPRKFADAITGLDAFKDAQKLAPVRQLYDSAAARLALQLLAFAEKELGAKWPELLDQLAGNGVALAFQLNPDPGPALLVLCGKDEKQVEKAFALALRVVEEELARQGAKLPVTRKTSGSIESGSIGADIHFARVGATVLVSNKAEAIDAALAEERRDSSKKGVHPARPAALGLLPKNPLAWLWVDLKSLKETKAAKDFFDATRQDFLQTLVLGATIDTIRRSDFLAAGLYQEKTGFRFALRMPAGRDGMWADLAMHVPPKDKTGTLPLLEPPGTIYSHSLHLDVAYMWANRARLINPEFRKQIEEGEKQLSRVLPSNVKFGELLEMWGPYHRVVVANHDARPYKTEPGLKLPAFGYVGTSRDPKFGPSLETVLRSAGLVGTLQYGLKMTEHEHEGVKLVAYRVPEDKPLPQDPDGIRFNFEPCFAVVGDEIVLATTVELGKKLITELKKPQSNKPHSAVLRGKLSAKAGAETLSGFTDPLVTNAVLGRGIGLTAARQEIADLVAFVKSLGTLTVELDVTEKEYRVDVVWTLPANGRR
jgi:hypothetical protein